MPFTNYMRSSIATLAALTSFVAYAQTSATKTQTVILVVKGESHVLRTTATTVCELLEEQHVVLTEQLLSSVPLTSQITEGMQVLIEPKAAPASAPTKKPAPMKVVAIKSGAARGTLSSRGTLGNLSRFEGKRVLTLSATGYGPGENGRWGDRTALGTRVRFGVVAVDPRVIKLGTRLYVEGYGECVAEDTGGAIKGMRIDLAFNSDSVANAYGRKRVRVVILD
ncbi:3D domain-containing protein [Armatimonas sp.]|uniref:3D domain-containing protein n=1 Tax=Armatimonas sp. TaxID=1872638 RepID=UPI003752375F